VTAFTESVVEEAALAWLESIGWPIAHGPDIAPDMPAAERQNYGEVVLAQRLRDAQARVLDFDDPDNNDRLAVNQFTVVDLPAGQAGNKRERRPGVVLFVNGLLLAALELKNAADEEATIWTAFRQLQTYQAEIPSVFAPNAVLVVSDGVEARVGTLTAGREWFKPWRTIGGETLAPDAMPQLRVVIEGLFAKRRFLDLVRDFIVFENEGGGRLVKKKTI
jgi:type I restriction enzyme R subunit